MPKSYAEEIKDELEYVSQFKESIIKVSSHLSELTKKRLEAYYTIIKDIKSYDVFKDMINNDSRGSVKAFREAVVLEIRYIESIYPYFKKFKSSFYKFTRSTPEKFDNEILANVDIIFTRMTISCMLYMRHLNEDLNNQLESTHISKAGVLLSLIPYVAKRQQRVMTNKFNEFIESVKSENEDRKKFRSEILRERKMLEKLIPKITSVLRKIDSDNNSGRKKESYESAGNKYVDDASDAFSIFSSDSGSSSISMPSFTGGGGSFGGGGASGSW